MKKLLTNEFYKTYLSLLDIKLEEALTQVQEREWTIENFRFYTAVSVMSRKKHTIFSLTLMEKFYRK